MNKNTLINFRVNKELKDEFQSVLDTEGFTISEVLEATMKDIVKRQMVPINIKTKIIKKPSPLLTIPFIKKCIDEVMIDKAFERVKSISLFGSYSKGNAQQKSDVDLFLELDRGFTLFDLGKLERELENKLEKKVDLATRTDDAGFMRHLSREKITLYERGT